MWNTSLVSLLRSPGKSIFGDDEFLWKSKKLLRPTLRLVWGKGGATAVDCSLLRNNNKNGNNNKHFRCWALLKFKLIIDLISGNPHCYHFFQWVITHDITEETIAQRGWVTYLQILSSQWESWLENEVCLTPKSVCHQPLLCYLFKSGGKGLASGYIFCVRQSMCLTTSILGSLVSEVPGELIDFQVPSSRVLGRIK